MKIQKLKKWKLLSSTSLLTLSVALVVACTPEKTTQQPQQSKEIVLKSKQIDEMLKRVNLYNLNSEKYLENKNKFDELTNSKTTTIEQLNALYNKILSDYNTAALSVIPNLFTENSDLKVEVDSLKKENTKIQEESTKQQKQHEELLKKQNEQNAQHNKETIEQLQSDKEKLENENQEIKSSFLKRHYSGKKALIEINDFTILFLEKTIEEIREAKDISAANKRSFINQINRLIEPLKNNREIYQQTVENRASLWNIASIIESRISYFSRISTALQDAKIKLPKLLESNKSFMNDLFRWRYDNIVAIEQQVSATDKSKFVSTNQTDGQKVKDEKIQQSKVFAFTTARLGGLNLQTLMSNDKKQDANLIAEAKPFQEQLINYATFLSQIWTPNYASKATSSDGNPIIDKSKWFIDFVISDFPLSNALLKTDDILSLKNQAQELHKKYADYLKTLGDGFRSIYYYKLNKPFYSALGNLKYIDYFNGEQTKLGILGYLTQANSDFSKYKLTADNLKSDLEKFKKENTEYIKKIDDKITEITAKKSQNDGNQKFHNEKIDQLLKDFNTEYTPIKSKTEDNMLKTFDKKLKLRFLYEKLLVLSNLYLYWEDLGLNPDSQELKDQLGYQKDTSENNKYNYYIPGQETIAWIRQWTNLYSDQWNDLSLESTVVDTDAYNTTTKSLLDISQNDNIAYINSTDANSFVSTSQSFDAKTFYKEFDALEKNYFLASEKVFKAIQSKDANLEQLKQELTDARNAYYTKLNDPNISFRSNAFTKFDTSVYAPATQIKAAFTPYTLANAFATFKASLVVLEHLNTLWNTTETTKVTSNNPKSQASTNENQGAKEQVNTESNNKTTNNQPAENKSTKTNTNS
ncbi:hypothetical protein ACXYRR_00750 [Mycoplasma sp. 246B]